MRTFLLLGLIACGGATADKPAEKATAQKAEAHEGHADKSAKKAEAPKDGWETFGTQLGVSEVVTAKALLDEPTKFVGKSLTVTGEVSDVCQKAGCWMVVSDGAERSMRVRMKDHGFAVAKDCAGAQTRVQGEVVEKRISKKEVDHFAGEAAKPEVMPEKGLAPDTVTYELIASAVQIKR